MSFVITVYAREGIVLAADSRLTLTYQRTGPNNTPHTVSVTSSDSARKLFLADGRVGISTYGAAAVNGAPIGGLMESLIVEKLNGKSLTPTQTANELLQYFSEVGVVQESLFHIAGYRQQGDKLEQEIVSVNLGTQAVAAVNVPGDQGATWGGEIDIFQRLTNNVAIMNAGGAAPTPIPQFAIPFQFFTLQDAIDFAGYAIRATIDTMRFQAREKTVGGPVDILVITPGTARWIAQKELKTI